jgi:hypothetical protein
MAAPAWAPTLTEVAVHVLSRTADTTTNEPTGTFSSATTPTATQVTELIAQACTRVIARTGLPVADTTEITDACKGAAALWAAAGVERTYPERNGDVDVYEQLRDDAEAATVAAVALNSAAGGGATVDPPDGEGGQGSTAVPTYSFPDAPAWADTSAYW